MYPDFKEQGAYVDYKATKDILHRMKENMANPATPDQLYESLSQQKKAVYQWCLAKVAELEKLAKAVYEASSQLEDNAQLNMTAAIRSVRMAQTHLEKSSSSSSSHHGSGEEAEEKDTPPPVDASVNAGQPNSHPMRPKDARHMADSIMHELLRFVECKNLNTDTVEHIVNRMYRYAVLGPTGEKWKRLPEDHDYNAIPIDTVFYYLSCIYDRVKTHEDQLSTTTKSSGAVGSQVFDRRSVKYWVHMQDLPFVIARIIPHLPLSTFTDTLAQSKSLGVPFTLFSPVSSVYWDNPQFLFYHRRLERVEGSTLIRMRWYSDTFTTDWDALKPSDRVFMEIKVHHEAWSGERSNKRRFALKYDEVDDFVAAKLSLKPALEKLQKKGAKTEDQEAFKSLATEILTKIHAYGLKPAMRTQCGRAAFQRGADQTVRVSIDTDLRFFAEDFGLAHHWRYEGKDAPCSTFPYAVVEVKLQCSENERIAPWIEELMACRHMESIPKFSKYAHGIASMYGHTSFIHMVPYWMHQQEIDIRAATKPELQQWDPTAGLATGCFQRSADRFVFGMAAAQTQSVGASEAKFLPKSTYARVYRQLVDALTEPEEDGQQAENSNNDTVREAPEVQYSVDHRHRAFADFHLFPYVESGVEPLFYKPPHSKNATALVNYGSIPWQVGKRIRVPQKYDPKTLLTAERYLAKWAFLSSHIGMLGIGIIQFGQSLQLPPKIAAWAPFWSPSFHITLGLILVGISLVTLLYAYVAFRARCRRVYARRKIRFDHPSGPTWLTSAMIFTFLVLGFFHVCTRYGPMITRSDDF